MLSPPRVGAGRRSRPAAPNRARFDETFDGTEGAGLARPVRPEEAEDLTVDHLQADVVYGRCSSVNDRQVAHLQDGAPTPWRLTGGGADGRLAALLARAERHDHPRPDLQFGVRAEEAGNVRG